MTKNYFNIFVKGKKIWRRVTSIKKTFSSKENYIFSYFPIHTLLNSTVKGIDEATHYSLKHTAEDLVGWGKTSGMKVEPDNNTKVNLYVKFRGKTMADISGTWGEKVEFIKVYEKEEFKED